MYYLTTADILSTYSILYLKAREKARESHCCYHMTGCWAAGITVTGVSTMLCIVRFGWFIASKCSIWFFIKAGYRDNLLYNIHVYIKKTFISNLSCLCNGQTSASAGSYTLQLESGLLLETGLLLERIRYFEKTNTYFVLNIIF